MKTLEYKKRFIGNCITGHEREYIKIDNIEIPLTGDEITIHRLETSPFDFTIRVHIDLSKYNMIKKGDIVKFEKIE